MTNHDRANRIGRTLMLYRVITRDEYDTPETDVIDFLTDLRHFCDEAELDLGALDRTAHRHYLTEKEAAT